MTGTPTPQPATPPMPFGAPPGPTRGMKVARRGHRLRAHAPAGRVHRLPRGRGARHRVRGPRDRHQRPTAVSAVGPVARAAELAALGHHAPLDRGARTTAWSRRSTTTPTLASVPRRLGALVRAAPDGVRHAAWLHALADPRPRFVDAARSSRPHCPTTWHRGRVGRRARRSRRDRGRGRGVVVGRARRHARDAGAVPRSPTSRADIATRSREAAVAASGALGDADALPVILDVCRDKPAVRRRAVLALAPFDGPEVDAAIDAALADRDWQVRQAAEDLRDRRSSVDRGASIRRVEEELLVARDVLGPFVSGPVPPVEPAGRIRVPVGRHHRRGVGHATAGSRARSTRCRPSSRCS